ncbi:membrane protein [Spirochaetia bacterium]|nr:membrane protein [Spirochaetia bacterium]
MRTTQKRNILFLLGILGIALVFGLAGCASTGGSKGGAKLPAFGADLLAKSSPVPGGNSIRIPYSSLISYYGYAKAGAEPDEMVEGHKTWYIYVWIPAVAPEIGVRMISPAPKGAEPQEGDFKSATWEEGKTDTEHYFDTWISLERAGNVTSPEDIAGASDWNRYGYNDDSSEMPKNPAGLVRNSLFRVSTDTSNPLKALVRGLYRVGFSTYKAGEVEGTFLAQIGAPIDLPGVVVGTLEEVQAAAK